MNSHSKASIEAFIRENDIPLRPTQGKLCVPVINRIYKKMLIGIRFSEIKVDNDVICDGHHRYIASRLANISIESTPGKTSPSVIIHDWKSIILETEDWDTAIKIQMLNEQDAEFNNIPLSQLVEMLR